VRQASSGNLASAPEVLCLAVHAGCKWVTVDVRHGGLSRVNDISDIQDDISLGVFQSETNTWNGDRDYRCLFLPTAKTIRNSNNGLVASIGPIRSRTDRGTTSSPDRNIPERYSGSPLQSGIHLATMDCVRSALWLRIAGHDWKYWFFGEAAQRVHAALRDENW